MTLNEMLDEVKRRNSVELDKELAELLHVSKQTVGQYRSGKITPGADTQLRIADLLALDPVRVAAACNASRAGNEHNRKRWLKAAAAVVLIGLSGMAAHVEKAAVCILCKTRRKIKTA